MAISKENKDFIDNLIDYYISESESYKQIAENFVPEVNSIPDTAFGIYYRMRVFRIFTSLSKSTANSKFRGHERI